MLRRLQVRNPKNEVLTLELSNPWSTGLNVKKIDGIGPPEADIYSTPYGSIDGGIYSGSRVPQREITMEIGLLDLPGQTCQQSRLVLYNYFRIKDPINILFLTDHRPPLQVYGYVSRNDIPMFTNDEIAYITVTCIDPWFYTQRSTVASMNTGGGEFEFSFESVEGATTYEEGLFEFGQISIDTRVNIPYYGDVETGFQMEIGFRDQVGDIYIYNMDTRERLTIHVKQVEESTGSAIGKGDTLLVSTVSGRKYARLVRGAMSYNVMNAIDINSDWFKISKGDNILAYSADSGVENMDINLYFQEAYVGI